ncbi:hypothetical protein ACWKSP_10735 [Micromonosporaceae bacterium Da 78-11]
MSVTPAFDFPGVFAAELLFIATGIKVGGGYDKNLLPCPELWMTKPLWTIAEHLY